MVAYLGCFQHLAVVNCAAMNIGMQETSFKDCPNNLECETEMFSQIITKKEIVFKTLFIAQYKIHIQLS